MNARKYQVFVEAVIASTLTVLTNANAHLDMNWHQTNNHAKTLTNVRELVGYAQTVSVKI